MLGRNLRLDGQDIPSSTGGRAPPELRFRADAGYAPTAEFGATSLTVGLTNLSGSVVEQHEELLDIAMGPETCRSGSTTRST